MGLITSIKDSITKLFSGGGPKRIGIYGPPNAGKCLAASEEILLSDGTTRSVEDVFLYAREKCPDASDVSDGPHETWIECLDAEIRVPALTNDLTIESTTVSHVFRQRYCGSMYLVQTSSGGEVIASPDHPFITVSENNIGKTRAGDISTGTTVARLPSVTPRTPQPSSPPARSLSDGREYSQTSRNFRNSQNHNGQLTADGGSEVLTYSSSCSASSSSSSISPSPSSALSLVGQLEATREALGMTRDGFYGYDDAETECIARTGRLGDSGSVSLDRIRSITKRLPRTEETEYIHALANGDTAWDTIVSVEKVDYDGYIYDLTVPHHHTFATADGLVVHNTTLANRVARDWTGDAVGPESHVPHETRRARRKENVEIQRNGSAVTIDIVDTPGVTTKVDYNEFLEHDMTKEDAVRRSREATEGVAEAMHWLREDVDGVIYVLDSTNDPFTQVNTMLVGIIESRSLPVLIFANKTDLDESSVQRIVNAFPQHEVVPLSALEGDNMQEVYDKIAEYFG